MSSFTKNRYNGWSFPDFRKAPFFRTVLWLKRKGSCETARRSGWKAAEKSLTDQTAAYWNKIKDMIRVHQVKTADPADLEKQLLHKLKLPARDLLSWKIHRRSIDARGQKVLYSYVIDAEVKNEEKFLGRKDIFKTPDETFRFHPEGEKPLENRPVVVGFGPAGLFGALLLAEYGYRPLVIERGSAIEKRTEDVNRFWKEGVLDPESNVQFGMGGAGSFSDGKLTTRSKDLKGRKVLSDLVSLGADEQILIDQHPHIGTDGFIEILKAARKRIEEQGGQFLFDTRLDDIETEDGRLVRIVLSQKDLDHPGQRKTFTLPAQALIFASGHSAEDTQRALHESGLQMEPKNFAVGVRIEHLQKFINEAMLHEAADHPDLIPARYQLTYTADTGRGVYTFCMCPGGYVIPASSAFETVVCNGMSYSDRAGSQANSALLVQVMPEDYGDGLFDGMNFQQKLEKDAYALSGSYKAPVQLASDFLEGRLSDHFEEVKPTYALGTVFADFNQIFPETIAHSLHEALENFEKKVPGFTKDAVLTGMETRSSSSIRISRDPKTLLSNIGGFYPCGEGSGYAGGIMTSAIDGLRCAMELMDVYARPDLHER